MGDRSLLPHHHFGVLGIDEDMIYQGSATMLYKHRYGKTFSCDKKNLRWSHWTERKSHSFIGYFRRRGIDISIWKTSTQIINEEDE